MGRLYAALEALIKPLLALLLAAITIGVFIQVALRYLFAQSFLWGEELSLFAFIWCVYLGTAVTSWRRSHMSFDMFEGRFGGRVLALQRLLVDGCMLTVALVLAWTGWQFSMLSVARLSPALGITLVVPTIVIPLAGALMGLVHGVDMLRDLQALVNGRPEPRESHQVDPA